MSLLGPQLEAFLAIVRCKTVHGAADVIALTQTAVTQRIRALEASLRTSLFIRTRRGMLLTQEGEALYRYCQSAKTLEGQVLAEIQGAGVHANISLSISGPTSLMSSRIVPACAAVMKKFPYLSLHFVINDTANRQQQLKSAQCDMAILSEENLAKEMRYKELKPEKYVLVAPIAWKKRRLKDIVQSEPIVDFDSDDQITYDYLKQYDLFEYCQHDRHFVNHTENLALLVSKELGYTTLTKEFADSYVKKGELYILNRGQVYEEKSVLAWYNRPELPIYFSEIIEAIY